MDKKTLYIHIGMHKTGTSALQTYFWQNRTFLLSQGVFYPATALSGPTQAKLANVFKGKQWIEVLRQLMHEHWSDEENPYSLEDHDDAESLYEDISRAIKSSEAKKAVISSECFLEWIDPRQVAKYIRNRGFDVKIVIYLRRQDEWIQSVYNQLIKDRFIRYCGPFHDMPQHKMLDYRKFLLEWEEAFGKENLLIRIYEPGGLSGNNIIIDFFRHILGIHINVEEDILHKEINQGLHKDVIRVLQYTNTLRGSIEEHRKILETLLPINEVLIERDGREGMKCLDASQREAILNMYQECNREIAINYVGNSDGILFSQAQPDCTQHI